MEITKLVSNKPQTVSKIISLDDAGKLTKETAAQITKATAEVVKVESLEAFTYVLKTLSTNECLIYGKPPVQRIDVITEREWYALNRPKDKTPRTKQAFSWPDEGGILMLDYDAPKDGNAALSKDQLIALVSSVVGDVSLLWYPSTSSCIYNGEAVLTGIAGQRIYIAIDNAHDIPAIGERINDRLWAQGYGRYEISKSGALLERPVFDASVWETNRIDFAAGAKCTPPLDQRRGDPIVHTRLSASISGVDQLAPICDEDLLAIERTKRNAKTAVESDAKRVKAEWLDQRVDELRRANPNLNIEQARDIAQRAQDRRELMGDYQLIVVDGQNEHLVSVLDVLDNPDRFHNLKTLDPIEPDYDGRRPVGKLYLIGNRPRLYSMAHGGQTFNLHRQPARIESVQGKHREATDELLDVLRRESNVFDFGQDLVTVSDNGSMFVHTADSLTYYVAGITQFFKRQGSDGREQLINPPPDVIRQIIALKNQRRLKPLDAVITAPTLRSDGSILDHEGYDENSRLLLIRNDDSGAYYIPNHPTEEQARQALDELWLPFQEFPYATNIDKAVHLAAVLTAAIRPSITTAPGFAYDAPTQGSGKTLLARCVGLLTTGSEPSVWPPLKNEDEIRKRIFATLLQGARVLLMDNMVEVFDSPSLAAALTSELYEERVLNKSESRSVPNRAVLMMTGNNMAVMGDMVRRINICRIDPQSETPFDRTFDLSPSAYCKTNRQRLIAAALTLIRFHLSRKESTNFESKSFAEWDTLVRETIIYINETIAPGAFGDVMEKTKESLNEDPTRNATLDLFESWFELIGETPTAAGDVLTLLESKTNVVEFDDKRDETVKRLESGIREIAGAPMVALNAKHIGHVLKTKKGAVVGGYRLTSAGMKRGYQMWMVGKV